MLNNSLAGNGCGCGVVYMNKELSSYNDKPTIHICAGNLDKAGSFEQSKFDRAMKDHYTRGRLVHEGSLFHRSKERWSQDWTFLRTTLEDILLFQYIYEENLDVDMLISASWGCEQLTHMQ